jgi:hypothetical protein
VSGGDDEIIVRFSPTMNEGAYAGNIALLGADLASEIRAGENRGRQLVHDFVVLDTREFRLVAADGSHIGRVRRDDLHSDFETMALAAWVTIEGNITPIQATGGWVTAP